MTKPKMGSMAEDSITGFSGKITGKVSYITGCDQYLLSPRVTDDGEYRKAVWFDEIRVVKPGKKAKVRTKKDPKGGPHSNMPRAK